MSVRPGEKHHVTAVFLISQEDVPRVLLLKHKKLGVWLPPGGHVDEDEAPFEGGLREVLEETGIDIRPFVAAPMKLDERVLSYPLPKYFFEETIAAHKDDPEHFHLDHVYVFEIPYQEPKLNEEESHDLRWLTRDEALALPIFVNVRMILEEILPS
jgi:8-oxo-dGTP pyrophosphatase MutT (NUDIX family)